jgi:RNA exonuclease NGL2
LEKLGPALEGVGYAYTFASGPRKKHGCVVAFKKDIYEKVSERTVHYDEYEVRPERVTEQARRGASFRTKNIGLLVALKRIRREGDNDNEGSVVVATTHLFWHPKYTYERARQAYILTRSVCEFRREFGLQAAPAFVAGG